MPGVCSPAPGHQGHTGWVTGTPLLPGSACRLASLQGGQEPQEVPSCRRLHFEVCGLRRAVILPEFLCLHEFYLKVTEKLKIEEFWLGREHGCSVALATAGSALLPTRATAGQVGQGTAHAGHSPSLPCPLLGPGACSLSPPQLVQAAPGPGWSWSPKTINGIT